MRYTITVVVETASRPPEGLSSAAIERDVLRLVGVPEGRVNVTTVATAPPTEVRPEQLKRAASAGVNWEALAARMDEIRRRGK